MTTLIDTHAHLNFAAFRNDADQVIKRALSNGVWMLNVGSQYTDSEKAVELAQRWPEGVYAAVGLHPIHLQTKPLNNKDFREIESPTQEQDFDYEKYKKLAMSGVEGSGVKGSKKIVALGELGLDYWREPKNKERQELFRRKQKEVLLKELELAQELNLPVIFHCRKAHKDLLSILSDERIRRGGQWRAVVHCFTGSWPEAQEYLSMGLYLGFNGIIYKLDLADVIKRTPLERMLVETDCPELAPPQAGVQRNEPLYVKYVAQTIAEIRNEPCEKIAQSTTENAKTLFGI